MDNPSHSQLTLFFWDYLIYIWQLLFDHPLTLTPFHKKQVAKAFLLYCSAYSLKTHCFLLTTVQFWTNLSPMKKDEEDHENDQALKPK